MVDLAVHWHHTAVAASSQNGVAAALPQKGETEFCSAFTASAPEMHGSLGIGGLHLEGGQHRPLGFWEGKFGKVQFRGLLEIRQGLLDGLALSGRAGLRVVGHEPFGVVIRVEDRSQCRHAPKVTPRSPASRQKMPLTSTPRDAMKVTDDAKACFAVLGQALTGSEKGRAGSGPGGETVI